MGLKQSKSPVNIDPTPPLPPFKFLLWKLKSSERFREEVFRSTKIRFDEPFKKLWGYETKIFDIYKPKEREEGKGSSFILERVFENFEECPPMEISRFLMVKENSEAIWFINFMIDTIKKEENIREHEHRGSKVGKYIKFKECYSGCIEKGLVLYQTIGDFSHWASLPLILCAWYMDKGCFLSLLPKEIMEYILLLTRIILTTEERVDKRREEGKNEERPLAHDLGKSIKTVREIKLGNSLRFKL
jgi:hypothetical protein